MQTLIFYASIIFIHLEKSFILCFPTALFLRPSSRTAVKSSNSSQSTVNRFSTKKPLAFLLHLTANGFLLLPGFKRSIT